MEDKLQDLERTLKIWEQEQPTCEKGISLKLKVIANLKESIEKIYEIKRNN